jgi:hypothetical protein
MGRRSFMKNIVTVGSLISVSSMRIEVLQADAPVEAAIRVLQTSNAAGDWGSFTASNQIGRYFHVLYPASTLSGELPLSVGYTLWIPDGVPMLRGVIVHQHGAGIPASQAGATAAYDLHWQALAKKWDCALMGPSYHVLNEATDLTPGGAELWFDPRRGSDKTFLQALRELADKSAHPEIATVPWCLWGHSGGGIWSNVMTVLHPQRVVAAFLRSGTAAVFRLRHRAEFPQPETPRAVYQVPTMINAGVREKEQVVEGQVVEGSIATFQEYRAKGAPIALALDPKTGHECGDSRYLAIPFFDACLAMRLPDKGCKDESLKPVDPKAGWLASFMGKVAVPMAEFKGIPEEASWLPNGTVAEKWMEYVNAGTVCDSTPPPPPFNIRASGKMDREVEITWDAEADLESGLGGFVILRDGQGLARLPEQPPKWVFGRPLFQGLSFHDTPEAPFPQMHYVDPTPQTGVKHSYTIISFNSAGVPSAPSAPASGL